MTKVLVTGFTGTLGTQVCKLLLEDGIHVVGYSRDEEKHSRYMKHEKLTMYLGDVRDRDRIIEASRGCDTIFHFAALKQVDRLEENPEEALQTNVLGTANVLHAQRINKTTRVLMSSTDKACCPINAYGYSKALAEKLTLRNENNIVTRYGNVLGSRGSFVPSLIKTLKEEKTIYVTDKRMTRWWLTPASAALFVYNASRRPKGGLAIPVMRAYPVLRLALLVAKILDIRNPNIVEVGIRPGEKLHEMLRTDEEGGVMVSSDQSTWFPEREILGVLQDEFASNW